MRMSIARLDSSYFQDTVEEVVDASASTHQLLQIDKTKIISTDICLVNTTFAGGYMVLTSALSQLSNWSRDISDADDQVIVLSHHKAGLN